MSDVALRIVLCCEPCAHDRFMLVPESGSCQRSSVYARIVNQGAKLSVLQIPAKVEGSPANVAVNACFQVDNRHGSNGAASSYSPVRSSVFVLSGCRERARLFCHDLKSPAVPKACGIWRLARVPPMLCAITHMESTRLQGHIFPSNSWRTTTSRWSRLIHLMPTDSAARNTGSFGPRSLLHWILLT